MSISIATSGGKEGFLWDQQYTKTSTLIIIDPQPTEDRGILSPQHSMHCLKTSILLPCLFHMIFSLFYGEMKSHVWILQQCLIHFWRSKFSFLPLLSSFLSLCLLSYATLKHPALRLPSHLCISVEYTGIVAPAKRNIEEFSSYSRDCDFAIHFQATFVHLGLWLNT